MKYGKKILLDIQPSSFIPRHIIERGVRILAITLAFQAREAGSIPARRSNFLPILADTPGVQARATSRHNYSPVHIPHKKINYPLVVKLPKF